MFEQHGPGLQAKQGFGQQIEVWLRFENVRSSHGAGVLRQHPKSCLTGSTVVSISRKYDVGRVRRGV